MDVEKPPPANEAIERELLTALIITDSPHTRMAFEKLQSRDFTCEWRGQLFEVLQGMYADGKDVTSEGMALEALKKTDGEVAELCRLLRHGSAATGLAANVQQYVRVLRDLRLARGAIWAGCDIVRRGEQQEPNPWVKMREHADKLEALAL